MIGMIRMFSAAALSVSLLMCAWSQEAVPQGPAAKADPEAAAEEKFQELRNVSIDFKDADIRSVLKIIAQKAGVNIVPTADVVGTISIKLYDIHWEKALDTIVRTYGFGYEWLNDQVIMVSTLEKLAQQRKISQETAENEPLDTQTFVINFSKASDVMSAVEKLVTAKGKITLDARTNTLIITDVKSNLMKVAEVIKRLDRMTPQVMIEAKIIETTLGMSEKLGIDWSTKITASGAKRPITFPWTSHVKGDGSKMYPLVQSPDRLEIVETIEYDSNNNATTTREEKVWNKLVPGFPAVDAENFTFGTLDFTQFKAVLEFLESRSHTKILSNAHITALNNHEARILVGTVVPIPRYEYSKDTGNTVIAGYDDKEVGIKLAVIPNINEKDFITLDVAPSVDTVIGSTGPNGERPVIATRSAITKVMVEDGKTLVMGGLISENNLKSKGGIPILRRIPVLDLIFGSKNNTNTKTELLIFITPHIVREGQEQFVPKSDDMDKMIQEYMNEKPAKKAKNAKKAKK